MSVLEFAENLHVEWNFELLGSSLSWDSYPDETSLRGFTGVSSGSIEVVKEALCRILIRAISTTTSEMGLVGILLFIDNHGHRALSGVESFVELLSAVQSLIDKQSRKRDMCEEGQLNTDTVRSSALTTYTLLLICFPDESVKIRSQFSRALVDMISRRNMKRKDYVNSFLRRIACECLSELEMSFPSSIEPFLTIPILSTYVQTETLPSFEGYTKLLLVMSPSPIPLKLVSLLLDPVDSSSIWYRSFLARRLCPFGSLTLVLHHFGHFLSSVHAHLVHSFFILALPFVSEWSPTLAHQVCTRLVAIGLTSSLPVKQLALIWIQSMKDNIPIRQFRNLFISPIESELQFQLTLGFDTNYCLTNTNDNVFRFLTRISKKRSFISEFLVSDILHNVELLPSVIALLARTSDESLRECVGEFLTKIEPASRVLDYSLLLEYLAVVLSDPTVVIRALQRADSEDWEKGMKLIRICHLILITRDDIYCPQILTLLRKCKDNVDVAQKAGLYIRLIETLDRGQRLQFLTLAKEEHKHIEQLALSRSPFVLDKPLMSMEMNKKLRVVRDNNWGVFDSATQTINLPFVISKAKLDMYALELSYSESVNFIPFEQTKIPLLTNTADSDKVSAAYNIWLSLKPIHPVPSSFEVFLEFTDEYGNSHKEELTRFDVAFEDLFVPLSESLWDSKWVDPVAQLLSVPEMKLRELINDKLGPFLISSRHDKNKRAFIHLPPKYHLLLDFEISPESCLVWIATDRAEIFLLVHEFFKSWH